MPIRPASASIATIFLLTAHPAGGQSLQHRPSSLHFVQYGVAVAAENLVSSGGVCPKDATTPCILGPGLGVAVRIGYRTRGPWYFGGAYQATRHDSYNILRLAILQQVRGELRYYFDYGNRLTPYALGAAGATAFGNEWNVDTGGPMMQLGGGLEFQVSTTAVVGLSLSWEAVALRAWTDGTGQNRANDMLGMGLTQWLTLGLVLEIRDPLPRW
jgi:hypothetical protein